MRDAIYYGRRLGMTAAGALDNPTWLDNQLYEWELQRDRDCIISYHFGLRLSLTHPVSPVELEMFKNIQPNFTKSRQLGDSFARTQSAESLLSYPHLIHWTAKAYVNPTYPKLEVTKDVVRELATKARLYRDLGPHRPPQAASPAATTGTPGAARCGPRRTRPRTPPRRASTCPPPFPSAVTSSPRRARSQASQSKVKESVR